MSILPMPHMLNFIDGPRIAMRNYPIGAAIFQGPAMFRVTNFQPEDDRLSDF